jgi:hypothetical protein
MDAGNDDRSGASKVRILRIEAAARDEANVRVCSCAGDKGGTKMPRKIADLDVREILRAKGEPFQLIMETVSGLGPDDVFQLHATFEPVPLLRVLGRQNWRGIVREVEPEHFIVQFSKEQTDRPYWRIDNRGLEPPQPMVRTLDLLDQEPRFASGEWGLEIWNDRVPAFLLPELTERGYDYVYDEMTDEDFVRVRIFKTYDSEN